VGELFLPALVSGLSEKYGQLNLEIPPLRVLVCLTFFFKGRGEVKGMGRLGAPLPPPPLSGRAETLLLTPPQGTLVA